MSLAPVTWAELGAERSTGETRPPGPGQLALLVVVVASVAVPRAQPELPGRGWFGVGLVALAVVAVAAFRLLPTSWWPARAAVAVAAGALAVPWSGKGSALWVAVSLLVGGWALLGRPPLPGLRSPPSTVGAVPVVLALVAWWRARSNPSLDAILVPAVAMAVVTTVASLVGERFVAVVDGFARRVGSSVTRGLFLVVGVPVIVVPWLVQRIVRVDPLEQARQEGSSWLDRSAEPVRPDVPWRRDATARPLPVASRARRLVATMAVTGVFTAALVPLAIELRRDPSGPATGAHRNTDPNAVPTALAGAAWYPEYLEDIGWLWQTAVAWDPLAPVRLRDVHTRHINIVDGARVTWRPPACGCRRLRVWMYGGSTTFGLGQRDGHTTSSALARRAWRDGVALDIDNRGVVGDTHWEEAQRLAWDLATLEPPDLVVFLDGINDAQAIDRLTGESRQPLSFVKADFWENFLATGGAASMDGRWAPSDGDGGSPPPGASEVTLPPLAATSPEEVGALVSGRYETARRISTSLAGDASVAVEWFWQPSIDSRPAIEGEPPPAGREYAEKVGDAAIAGLGARVHDISGALDRVDEPLYWDQYHTNEAGATVVADAMYRELRQRLSALVEGAS
ncbi:MAG: hypothetical protein JWM47_1710 [Acidimicrobiales bacterium]|nr:hypothetical protein [Acidimicrobiales bacterium]